MPLLALYLSLSIEKEKVCKGDRQWEKETEREKQVETDRQRKVERYLESERLRGVCRG